MSRAPSLLALPLVALLAGCPGGGAGERTPLNVMTFPDYLDPELVAEFEQQHGAKVHPTLYESSEELLPKLQQQGSGADAFDLCITSHHVVSMLVELKLVQALDHSALPGLRHLAPRFRDPEYDQGGRHSVAYQWGTVGLMYDKRKHPALEPTWGVLFDESKRVGTFLLIDEMRDQIGVALRYQGASVNSADKAELIRARDLLLAAKRSSRLSGFDTGTKAKNRVVDGLVDMAVVWNGDAVKAIKAGKQDALAYVIPREGSLLWTDAIVVPSATPRKALAHAFIEFMLDPKRAARLSAFTKFATPNQAALEHLPKADREDPAIYPPEETMKRLEYQRNVGDKLKLYDEVWTAVKAR